MVVANSRINIERLRKEDREALEEMAEELCRMATRIEKLRDLFEGKLHTRLDKVRLGLDDAIEGLELVEL
jgi:hypothetical protein